MGAITREKGVLKLVHPGRYIEIHTQPITATEVMRKDPGTLLLGLMCLSFHILWLKLRQFWFLVNFSSLFL
jgi:hypothetical protein